MSNLSKHKILYEDDYVKVDEDRGVFIKNYFFPTFTNKHISWKSIKSFEWWHGKHSAIQGLDYKGWGMALTDTWWALDIKRVKTDHECVIINTGKKWQKGFTCRDPRTLLKVLRDHERRRQGLPEEESEEEEDTSVEKEKERQRRIEED